MTTFRAWVALGAAAALAHPLPSDPPAALDAYAELARADLWPGFEAASVPLALYDGSRTWLVRHPQPPPEFERYAESDVFFVEGRHAAIRANAPVQIHGVWVAGATVGGGATPRDDASLVLHEAFHVFQRRRHPSWQGDEGVLLTYPFDDADVLAARRLETESLRRALAETDAAKVERWTIAALEWRERRFARLSPAEQAYERRTELNEGLARYVEHASLDPRHRPNLPEAGFEVTDLRGRAYETGHAFGVLLDRFVPGWKQRLEGQDPLSLDRMLADALADSATEPGEFPYLQAAVERRARANVDALVRERAATREAFVADERWRVVIELGNPMFAEGFDPMNLTVLGGGEILHTRWLKLTAGHSFVEAEGHPALTEPLGAHPLQDGVKRVTVGGFEERPEARFEAGAVLVAAPGFSARLQGAQMTFEGQVLRVLARRR